MKTLPFLLCLSIFSSLSNGYNILAVFQHEGKSHQKVFGPIVRELVSRGSNLTVIVHYTFNIEHADEYEEILLGDEMKTGEFFFDLTSFENVNLVVAQTVHPFMLTDMGLDSCRGMLSNSKVQALLSVKKKFDLILAEFFNSDCVFGLAQYFDAPVVGLSAGTLMPWYNDRFGNPDNPSYIPNNHLWHTDKMGFLGRTENLIGTLWYNSVYWWRIRETKELVESFIHQNLDSFYDKIKNASLILVNSHLSWTFPRPLVPAVVEIGGVHITESSDLPENIEKFINESTHGVIYFSLGSMIKGHTFPEEKRQEFLKAFARLPQRVLWKWENETMPGKPDNIMIQKWMPQFDILSHPNVKAFISHAGLLGTTEAVHCGVPMLLMPQYGDQHTNARAVEANGGGIVLYLKDVTEEKVYESLKTLMSPEFTAKTKALSERFRDRPMSPMDTAIYWIEYVARHKGAPHLKTAAVDMPLYQYLLLDVIGFLALIFLAFSYIVYKIIRLIYRAIFSKNKVKKN